MGALLLTLVVIVAVGSFALFVSITQSNAQNRSNYITNVQNENLQVTSINPSPNNAAIQYEAFNPSNPSSIYYIQIHNATNVLMIAPNETQYDTNLCEEFSASCAVLADYSFITSSTSNTVAYITGSFPTYYLVFSGTGNTSDLLQFQVATWQTLTMTIRNLNTQNSGLSGVSVNAHDLLSWNLLSQSGSIIGAYTDSPPLVIVAKTSVTISVNIANFSIPKTSAISILLLSSAYNFFAATFSPPTSVISASTTSENYLVTTRDIPMFSGSQSNSSGSSITNYIWQIEVPNSTSNSGYTTAFAYGQSVQYEPESLFSRFTNLTITGPIIVTLTTVNTNGLMSISQSLVYPNDPNIAPPAELSQATAKSCLNNTGDTYTNATFSVSLQNIFGQYVANAPVLFITGNQQTNLNFSVSPTLSLTDSLGAATTYATYSYDTSPILEVESGALPPLFVALSCP